MEDTEATAEDDNYFDSYEDIEVGLVCSDNFVLFLNPVVAFCPSV